MHFSPHRYSRLQDTDVRAALSKESANEIGYRGLTSVRLRPAQGVLTRTVGDQEMLLHPSAERALSLNPTAAAVWAHCQPGAQLETVLAQLAAAYDVDAETIRADVTTTIDHLVELGFLQVG
jgi:hypothetical protein